MPFGMWTRVGAKKRARWVRSPHAKGQCWGGKWPIQDVWRSIYSQRHSSGLHRYSADSSWGVLDGVHIGETWRIRLNRPWATVMRPYAKWLWKPRNCIFSLKRCILFSPKNTKQLKNITRSDLNNPSLSKRSTGCTRQDLGREHSILLSATHMLDLY